MQTLFPAATTLISESWIKIICGNKLVTMTGNWQLATVNCTKRPAITIEKLDYLRFCYR